MFNKIDNIFLSLPPMIVDVYDWILFHTVEW